MPDAYRVCLLKDGEVVDEDELVMAPWYKDAIRKSRLYAYNNIYYVESNMDPAGLGRFWEVNAGGRMFELKRWDEKVKSKEERELEAQRGTEYTLDGELKYHHDEDIYSLYGPTLRYAVANEFFQYPGLSWDEEDLYWQDEYSDRKMLVQEYDVDTTAAFEIAEFLLDVLPEEDLHIEHCRGNWYISCYYENELFSGRIKGPTIAIALCRTALFIAREARKLDKTIYESMNDAYPSLDKMREQFREVDKNG